MNGTSKSLNNSNCPPNFVPNAVRDNCTEPTVVVVDDVPINVDDTVVRRTTHTDYDPRHNTFQTTQSTVESESNNVIDYQQPSTDVVVLTNSKLSSKETVPTLSSSTSPTLSTQTSTGRTTSSTTSTSRHSNLGGGSHSKIIVTSVPSSGSTPVIRPIPLKAANVVVVLNIKTRCRSLADVVVERETIGGSRNPSPEDDDDDTERRIDEEQDVNQFVVGRGISLTLRKPKVTFDPTSYHSFFDEIDRDNIITTGEFFYDGESKCNDYDDEDTPRDNVHSYIKATNNNNNNNHHHHSVNWIGKFHHTNQKKYSNNALSKRLVDMINPTDISVPVVIRPKPLRITDLLMIAENESSYDQNLDEFFPVTTSRAFYHNKSYHIVEDRTKVICHDDDDVHDDNDDDDDSVIGRIGSSIKINLNFVANNDDGRSSANNHVSCLGSSSASSSTLSSHHSP